MHPLSIAAAGFNLASSPAMLITRLGGRLGYALAVARLSKTSASEVFSQNRKLNHDLEGTW